jgi:hypothetical protein
MITRPRTRSELTSNDRLPSSSGAVTPNCRPITADVLEKCLDRVALAIDRAGHKGAVYLPIYDRLEAELKALKDKEDRLARIKARVRR